MQATAIALLLGVMAYQQLPFVVELPGLIGVVVILLGLRFRVTRLLAVLAAGFFWAGLVASGLLRAGLDPLLEGKDVLIEGVITTIPVSQGNASRFNFRPSAWMSRDFSGAYPRNIRLTWYGRTPRLMAGQRWRLTVRLKRPHGFMNPGGFRYEDWLFSQRIRATGYVRKAVSNHLLGLSSRVMDRLQYFRQGIFDRLTARLRPDAMAGIITALAMGERQGMSPEQWQVLTRTGTSHLVAISGLHIGLVAAWCVLFFRMIAVRSVKLLTLIPASQVAAVAGLLGAVLYAALAGFALPTQRALIMVSVGMLVLLIRHRYRASHALSMAMVAVLLYDPLSVISPGFWLSFGAVAIILLSMGHRVHATGLWWRWGRVHVILSLALLPLLLLFFQQGPLYSPLANFIAVPWVALVVVPLALLGVLCLWLWAPLGAIVLQGATACMGMLWPLLASMAQWPGGQIHLGVASAWILLPAVLGILLFLGPRGLPGRWLSMVMLLPMAIPGSDRIPSGGFQFTLLDVGQGLAVVVRTRHHVMVYDTGPRYGAHFDAGKAVLVPYLRHEGISRIDTLVVSHGDSDHMGGTASLRASIKIGRIVTSIPERFPAAEPAAVRCQAGLAWRWDDVDFRIIHPAPDYQGSGNNRSCVLSIGRPDHAILLAGDIEAEAESVLLHTPQADALRAHVLVAPHHGSLTSSTGPFIHQVNPDWVLFSVGYRNRFAFPRPKIRARYRSLGADAYDTATGGAIQIQVKPDGRMSVPVYYRDEVRRYWHWPA